MDLEIFCSEGSGIMSKPFVERGIRYATDARILVAVKTDEPDSEYDHPKKVQELFESVWDEGWEPLKMELPDRTPSNCLICDGDGIRRIDCDVCEGTGQHTCDCGTEHDCGYCAHGGIKSEDETCNICGGDGKAYENQRYGVVYFSGYLIAKIVNNLPLPQITEMSTGSKILRFDFDGGKGLLMGMSEDSYK